MTEFSLLFADPKTEPTLLYSAETLDFLGPVGGENEEELRKILSLESTRRDMTFRREILEDFFQSPVLFTACEAILRRWEGLEEQASREKNPTPDQPFGEILSALQETVRSTLEHLRFFSLAYGEISDLSPASGGLFAFSEFLRRHAQSPRARALTEQLVPIPLLREEQAKGVLQLNLDRYGAVSSADLSYLGPDVDKYLKKHPPRREELSVHLPLEGARDRLRQGVCRFCGALTRLNREIRRGAEVLRQGLIFYQHALSVIDRARTEEVPWVFASPVARHGPAGRGIRDLSLGKDYPPLTCTARSLEAYAGSWGTETLRVIARLQIFSAAGLPVMAEDLVFCPEERIRVYDSSGKTVEEEIEALGALYRTLGPGDTLLLNQPLITVGNASAKEIMGNLLRAFHKKGAAVRLATDLAVE